MGSSPTQGTLLWGGLLTGSLWTPNSQNADVSIYEKGPSGLSAFSVLVLPAMFIGLGSLVWWHQWRRDYKDHLHILASYAEAERES